MCTRWPGAFLHPPPRPHRAVQKSPGPAPRRAAQVSEIPTLVSHPHLVSLLRALSGEEEMMYTGEWCVLNSSVPLSTGDPWLPGKIRATGGGRCQCASGGVRLSAPRAPSVSLAEPGRSDPGNFSIRLSRAAARPHLGTQCSGEPAGTPSGAGRGRLPAAAGAAPVGCLLCPSAGPCERGALYFASPFALVSRGRSVRHAFPPLPTPEST